MEVTLRDGQIGATVCTETFRLWRLSQFHVFAKVTRFRRMNTSTRILFLSAKADATKASSNCHFAVGEPQQPKLMKTPTAEGTHSTERCSRPGLCAEAYGQFLPLGTVDIVGGVILSWG